MKYMNEKLKNCKVYSVRFDIIDNNGFEKHIKFNLQELILFVNSHNIQKNVRFYKSNICFDKDFLEAITKVYNGKEVKCISQSIHS